MPILTVQKNDNNNNIQKITNSKVLRVLNHCTVQLNKNLLQIQSNLTKKNQFSFHNNKVARNTSVSANSIFRRLF